MSAAGDRLKLASGLPRSMTLVRAERTRSRIMTARRRIEEKLGACGATIERLSG